MIVLIAKTNEGILKGIRKGLKFKESTVNTSTFNCTQKTFKEIYAEAQSLGYNPYALMSW